MSEREGKSDCVREREREAEGEGEEKGERVSQ